MPRKKPPTPEELMALFQSMHWLDQCEFQRQFLDLPLNDFLKVERDMGREWLHRLTRAEQELERLRPLDGMRNKPNSRLVELRYRTIHFLLAVRGVPHKTEPDWAAIGESLGRWRRELIVKGRLPDDWYDRSGEGQDVYLKANRIDLGTLRREYKTWLKKHPRAAWKQVDGGWQFVESAD